MIRGLTPERRPQNGGNSNSWMITLADLLALLLTFFVMLLSMNTVHYEKWNAIIHSFSAELNPARESFSFDAGTIGRDAKPVIESRISLDYLAAVFERSVAGYRVPGLQVQRLDDRVAISLPAHYVLAPGNQRLSPNGRLIIADLAEVLRQLPNRVVVAGHNSGPNSALPTLSENGNVAIGGWVESINMADIVANALNTASYRGNITIYGMGNSRISHLNMVENALETANLAQRIDILVLDEVEELVNNEGS